MDLEKLLEQEVAAKKDADARAAAKRERVASEFTTYIAAIKERVVEALGDVKGIGPLSWSGHSIDTENSGIVKSLVRGRTESQSNTFVLEVSALLRWYHDYGTPRGRVEHIKVFISKASGGAKRGTAFVNIDRPTGDGESEYPLPGDVHQAIERAVADLARDGR